MKKTCYNCGHIDPKEGPFCWHDAGDNFGHCTEVCGDGYCTNWTPRPTPMFSHDDEVVLNSINTNSGYILYSSYDNGCWRYWVCIREKDMGNYWQVHGVWIPEDMLEKVDHIIFNN